MYILFHLRLFRFYSYSPAVFIWPIFCFALFHFVLILILSTRSLKAITRYGVTRKRQETREKHLGKLVNKGLEIKGFYRLTLGLILLRSYVKRKRYASKISNYL